MLSAPDKEYGGGDNNGGAIEWVPGNKRAGNLAPILFDDNCSVKEAPPSMTGLGAKEQATPVGSVAGLQVNAIDSAAMPVPAVIEIGMLIEPP